MAFKIIIHSERSKIFDDTREYELYNEFLFNFLEIVKYNKVLKFSIDIDTSIITLKQYIDVINIYNKHYNIPKFLLPNDVKSSCQLQRWINALELINDLDNYSM